MNLDSARLEKKRHRDLILAKKNVVAGPMSAGGDSGSAVLDQEDFVIGLLFAGSESTTIINPIQYVLQALNIAIAT